jgi:Beta-lactamase
LAFLILKALRPRTASLAACTYGGWITLVLCASLALSAESSDSPSIRELQQPNWRGSLTSNAAFTPAANAGPAREPFVGTLTLAESRMTTTPASFKAATVLGRDPQLFPSVRVSFFTVDGDLVPVTQEVLQAASAGRGRSYWDLIVQPGAVWSKPQDGRWSRAGFPFALINSLEGETHNGVATFAYRRGKVTNVRVQIVQQTAPFYIVDYFTATAQIDANWLPAPAVDFQAARLRYQAVLRDRLPIARWDELAPRIPEALLANFDDGEAGDIAVSGLDYNGTIYLKTCSTVAGPLPWCDRARFGVWSATKSLVNEVALLHLAQKYGPTVFAERIVDFVPQAATNPGWDNVTFGDAANMATGLGNGSPNRNPNNILAGGLEHYASWYEARTEEQKIDAALAGAKPFPWRPGLVARYRDQDMFMLGVAMDRYVKKKNGASASVWKMLSNEVFEPIGIHDAPINKTLETSGREGQPLMAFGFYPTISDIVRIARLYQSGGAYQGQQLLYAPRIREIFSRSKEPGLPTGQFSSAGESYYFNAFWREPYGIQECNGYYPQMEGWGGTVVALFPGKLTGIRIAKIWEENATTASGTAGMAAVANHLDDFCHPRNRS